MRIFFVSMSLFIASVSAAQLQLPAFFTDHMVLQQNQPCRIWGKAASDQPVQVQFLGKTYYSYADKAGNWSMFLDPATGGKKGVITISSGMQSIQLNDVVTGEVWICSGQSNMEWRMDMLPDTYPEELKTAQNDQIRFMTVNKWLATTPVADVEVLNKWEAIKPSTVGNCSAAAYWFAKKLQKELGVPVGLIVSSWGGTPAQSWTSFEGLSAFPYYVKTYREKIRPMNLDNLSQQKKDLYQQFLTTVQQQGAFAQKAMQPDFDDSKWETMALPRPWEELGYPALDGVVAYRIYFNVSAEDAGKAAVLNTPGIDDMDSTWINGRFIGTTDQWDKPRTYTIPAGVLKAGTNLLAVRVQDNQGGGGFAAVPDKFNVRIGDKLIALSGNAKFTIIAELKDLTAGHGAIEHQPAVLFNAMIAPLLPLQFKGVIWYQGESNADTKASSLEYRELFPAMIRDWRYRAGRDFPFVFVQLASFGPLKNEPAESNWALLREAQLQTLQLPNTGMAVATDIGNPQNIHPVQKKEVGDRLADEAIRVTYGKINQASSGPLYSFAVRKGNQLVVQFSKTGKGLMAKGGALKQFAIAGADKKFYWATAAIKGSQVILTCKQVPVPVAVRYAWADSPVEANLYNIDGYPASPFRSDNW